MKTPREILLNRHQNADAQLALVDPVQLAKLTRQPAADKPSPRFSLSLLFAHLFGEAVWPWRRIWLGVGAAWICIFAANFLMHGSPSRETVTASRTDPQTRIVLIEQRRMLAQLLEPNSPPPRLIPITPGPRSDARLQEIYV